MTATAALPPRPPPACPAPRVARTGTAKGRPRSHCGTRGAWFGAPTGTPVSRLRAPPADIGRTLTIVRRRGSRRAAEEVTGHEAETIARRLRLAAAHAEAPTGALARDLPLGAAGVDECRSFVNRSSATSRRPTRRGWATAGGA